MTKKYYLLAFILILSDLSLKAQNFLNNGDFESGGNGVGFSINSNFYNAVSQPFPGTTQPGQYGVTNNPQLLDNAFLPGGDHSTGTGNMLVVNSTTTGGSQRFWRAGNNGGGVCNLTVGSNYIFSFWVKSVSAGPRASFGYQILGTSNFTLFSGSDTAPLPADGWQQIVYTFTATNNCVNIEIWNNNTSGPGNDFAVDDFSVTGPPQPLSFTYSSVNPACAGNANGQIIGYASGANPPYEFFLTGAATAQNSTGIFTGLAAGTYSLMVLEGADGQITINNIALSDPANLVLSSPVTICADDNTTLSVSGGSGYTWTANPPDTSLQTPNNPNPVVSPDQTTTYTVTSSNTAAQNLIFNGDFSAGNIGFLTNYVYYTPSNPSGIQRAYGIVTNPQNWESGFVSTGDHTDGTGKMLVVDGSTVNSGNDKVWCQTVAVTPNQNYTFSYWIRTVALPNIARIDVVINGVSIGSDLAPASDINAGWEPRTYSWNSGLNTTAQICIYDRETTPNGNDFAIDDISFTGPATICNRSGSVTITVNTRTVPDFPPTIGLCLGSTAPILQTTSPNGITGVWTPSVVSNTLSGVYNFQPNANQCASATSLQVNVGNALTPTFTQVGPICAGQNMSPLPTTSLNNIAGTWTPALNNLQTTTYTFNPAPDQCGILTTMEIVVNPNVIPTFTQVAPICAGTTINDLLPSISANGIVGSWSPPFDNTTTRNYTFTPNAGQCATTANMTVTVIQNITPTFTGVGSICIGAVLNPLPTTSLDGITGTWSPALNNTATTVYTFTPAADQCATTTTMQIIVNPANAIPIFDFGPLLTICYGPGPALALPTESSNGITGSWNPSIVNTLLLGETDYIFTPDPINTCAGTVTITVNVIGGAAYALRSGCDGTDFVLSVEPKPTQVTSYTWYNSQNEIIATNASVIITEAGDYKVVINDGSACAAELPITVDSVYCKIPKGISPNTDNYNDFFELSNLNVSKLQIFNRYGTEVYSKANYKNEWDGRSDNGNILPDGTYYYVINFETGKAKSGWVYINK